MTINSRMTVDIRGRIASLTLKEMAQAESSRSAYLLNLTSSIHTAVSLLTNRTLDAAQALEWGILNRVVNDSDLLAEAERLAQQLAQGPAAALASTKRLLASSLPGFQDHLALESAAIARQGLNSEAREGIGAFLGKRRPQFAPMGES
jgi:2-(1,2-epoxy-1,2-dihydrophenyl)acetyl-CoA isomerase